MQLSDWIQQATARLTTAQIASPKLEAQVLAAHVLLVDRTFILTHPEHEFNELAGEALLQRRQAHEPLAYILGYREFFGRRFRVNPDVLIPRPDTETLIEEALKLPNQPVTVLDIGTGSGCIAVTLKLEKPSWTVTATDVSADALQVARENAETLGAECTFRISDLFEHIEDQQFDLIVSNPPYIVNDYPLEAEVADHEPTLALFGGADGLDIYRRLAEQARDHLAPEGQLILEIGFDQGTTVPDLFERAGWSTEVLKDLSGNDRVVIAKPSPQG